ncbi:MAG: hypothetical protein V3V01_10230 [Acidimicrobiales bacterium]
MSLIKASLMGVLRVGVVVSDMSLNPGCTVGLLALLPGIRNVSDTGGLESKQNKGRGVRDE